MNFKTVVLSFVIFAVQFTSFGKSGDYRSPLSMVKSLDGKELYVAEITAKTLAVVDLEDRKVKRNFKLKGEPMGLVLAKDGKSIYVTLGVADGLVDQIDVISGDIISEIKVGHSPIAPQLSLDGKTLYVCNRFNNNVSFVDLEAGKVVKKVAVTREPVASQLTKDGRFLFVANHLPNGAANVEHMTSVVSVIDTVAGKIVKSIVLPNGAIDLRGMCISNDGKYIYLPSILARFLVPTTQIERGWINTHALNIIKVKEQRLAYTVLLDDVDLGAANPWGITCTEDGKYIAVAHSATNEVSLIDRVKLHEKLKNYPEDTTTTLEERENYEYLPNNPANDLSFLTGIRVRVKLPGIGPRGIISVKNVIYVAQYFTGNIAKIVPGYRVDVSEIPLGPKEKMDQVREGEMFFNDASLCFQQWQACSTCHPDARTDAVNWDLLNDGIGNPKSTKNLLYSHVTPPVMITGVRDKAETAVRAGIKYIQFSVVDEVKASAIDAYLKSLRPVPSPYLKDGEISEAARRGAKVFFKAGCANCHSGPYYSNGGMYDVGTTDGIDKGRLLNVPNLVEVWRTAPYLYDGRAATMKEVFTKFNKDNLHGDTKDLTDNELDDLVEFVNSL